MKPRRTKMDWVKEQAATIARLERELAEARAKAGALDALAGWMEDTSDPVEYMYHRSGLFRVRLMSGAPECGIADTLPAAIMDALEKAKR